jgi:hypothetical protein
MEVINQTSEVLEKKLASISLRGFTELLEELLHGRKVLCHCALEEM